MNFCISVSGLISTGSSAFIDYLNEYDKIYYGYTGEFKPFNFGLYWYIMDQYNDDIERKYKKIKKNKLKEAPSNIIKYKICKYLHKNYPAIFNNVYNYELVYPGYRCFISNLIDNIYIIKNKYVNDKSKREILLKEEVSLFIRKIVKSLNTNKIVILNQMIKPEQINLLDWVDHTKAIIVYRDPRDQFAEIINRPVIPLRYRYNNRVINFVNWHKERLKKLMSYNEKSKFLTLNFEDLVFKEHFTRKKVEKFLGLNDEPYSSNRFFFNDKAKKSIGIYKKSLPEPELEYIENNLKELLIL